MLWTFFETRVYILITLWLLNCHFTAVVVPDWRVWCAVEHVRVHVQESAVSGDWWGRSHLGPRLWGGDATDCPATAKYGIITQLVYLLLAVVTLSALLHSFNGLFSRTAWVSHCQNGKTFLDCNEARDGGVLGWHCHQTGHIQTVCTLLQTDNHASTSSLSFYGPYALFDAHPTVSRHER